MPVSARARTGLMLFLTAGPLLVFVFLYLFGNNQYEIDRYSPGATDLVLTGEPLPGEPVLVYDESIPGACTREAFLNQRTRISDRWKYLGRKPAEFFIPISPSVNPPSGQRLARKPESLSWWTGDTVVAIETAKGPALKRLPDPPRAFLFDKKHNLRGVYGLCNRSSVDTLLLEYSILTD